MEDKKSGKNQFGKGLLVGIGAALGTVALGLGGLSLYSKMKNKKEEETDKGEKLTHEDDDIVKKLEKQKTLKPKIVTEYDEKNYIRSTSGTVADDDDDENLGQSFICPINQTIMTDPVITPYGTTYERSAIENWLDSHDTDPLTKKKLTKDMLVTNYALKAAIQEQRELKNSNKTK